MTVGIAILAIAIRRIKIQNRQHSVLNRNIKIAKIVVSIRRKIVMKAISSNNSVSPFTRPQIPLPPRTLNRSGGGKGQEVVTTVLRGLSSSVHRAVSAVRLPIPLASAPLFSGQHFDTTH